MIGFGKNPLNDEKNQWRKQLAEFVKMNQQELAALDWGLRQEEGQSDHVLGIDLEPVPHFVCCAKEAITELNRKVNNHLQEVIGIVDNHNPEKEVLLIGIYQGQIKLVQFASEPTPEICFQQVGADVDQLLEQLELRLTEHMRL